MWWRWVPTVPLLLLQRVEDVAVLVDRAERRRPRRKRRLRPPPLLRLRATREVGNGR